MYLTNWSTCTLWIDMYIDQVKRTIMAPKPYLIKKFLALFNPTPSVSQCPKSQATLVIDQHCSASPNKRVTISTIQCPHFKRHYSVTSTARDFIEQWEASGVWSEGLISVVNLFGLFFTLDPPLLEQRSLRTLFRNTQVYSIQLAADVCKQHVYVSRLTVETGTLSSRSRFSHFLKNSETKDLVS